MQIKPMKSVLAIVRKIKPWHIYLIVLVWLALCPGFYLVSQSEQMSNPTWRNQVINYLSVAKGLTMDKVSELNEYELEALMSEIYSTFPFYTDEQATPITMVWNRWRPSGLLWFTGFLFVFLLSLEFLQLPSEARDRR